MNKKNKKNSTFLEVSDYFNIYKDISNSTDAFDAGFKEAKIALLTSFTTRGLKEMLSVQCWQNNIKLDVYEGGYNQYAQEIINNDSGLYKFKAGIIFLFIDIKHLLGDDYFQLYNKNKKERTKTINDKENEFLSYLEKLKEQTKSKIVFSNFEIPSSSPLGPAESKEESGFIELIEKFNFDIRDKFKKDNQVYVFDFNGFCSMIGKNKVVDYKMYYLADMKIDLQVLPVLAEQYMSYIKPITIGSRKCIVLDLDNTLWGGVIGEDGLEGIKLGPSPDGRSFWEFQKYLLSLFEKGIILAINSKNNRDDAMQALRQHPFMILKEKHFASIQANWSDKVSNMRTIAKEINIGLDSMVFFDDDKLNREMVSTELPEVKVIEMPDDPSLYLKTITEVNDFCSLKITKEDKVKGKMYVEQRERSELKSKITDITSYLKNLELVVEIQKANKFNISRITQLTQKTNQFNLTSRRYQEEDIKRFFDDGDLVVSFTVKDKFGDNGLTGLVIVEKNSDVWRIDTFLLSCRIIGRRIEEIMLKYIIDEAKNNRIKILIGEYIPTKKNISVKDFFVNNRFIYKESCDNILKYEYECRKQYDFPEFIKMVII